MGFIIHSAKGTTWSNHKYVKKVGNKYYYKDSKGNLVEGDPAEQEESTDNTKSDDSKTSSKNNTNNDRIKKLADSVMAGKLGQNQLRTSNNGKDYMDVMNAVNSKFKKPSGSGKSSSKDKSTKEKTSKDTTKAESKKANKTEVKETAQQTNQIENTKVEEAATKSEEVKTETKETKETTATDNSVSASIKSAIKSVAQFSDNDSIYATKNEDGTTTVTVDFEDGTTQTFTLAQTFDVVSKTEKTKKQLTHSIFKGRGYLVHRML